jgi:hypothetical protein
VLEIANVYDTVIGEHKRLILLANQNVNDRIVFEKQGKKVSPGLNL